LQAMKGGHKEGLMVDERRGQKRGELQVDKSKDVRPVPNRGGRGRKNRQKSISIKKHKKKGSGG